MKISGFIFIKYYYGDRIEKETLGGDCSMHRRRRKARTLGGLTYIIRMGSKEK